MGAEIFSLFSLATLMTLHITLAVAFGLLALIKRNERVEYGLLVAVYLSLFVITYLYDHNDSTLYWLRMLVAVAAGFALAARKTDLGWYQATIQAAILCSYGMLSYDVSQGQHVLIYNKFETVIYGLVACQFVGVFTGLRTINYHRVTSFVARYLHIQRN